MLINLLGQVGQQMSLWVAPRDSIQKSKNWRHGESVALQVEFSSTQMPTSPEARCCDGRASEMFPEKHCVRLQAWHKSNLRTADFANLIFFASQISSAKWHKWDFGFIVPDVKEPLRTPTPVRTPPPPRTSVGVAQHLAAFSSWTNIQRTESITMVSVLCICISITVMKVLSQILNWWESFRNSIKNEGFPASLWFSAGKVHVADAKVEIKPKTPSPSKAGIFQLCSLVLCSARWEAVETSIEALLHEL